METKTYNMKLADNSKAAAGVSKILQTAGVDGKKDKVEKETTLVFNIEGVENLKKANEEMAKLQNFMSQKGNYGKTNEKIISSWFTTQTDGYRRLLKAYENYQNATKNGKSKANLLEDDNAKTVMRSVNAWASLSENPKKELENLKNTRPEISKLVTDINNEISKLGESGKGAYKKYGLDHLTELFKPLIEFQKLGGDMTQFNPNFGKMTDSMKAVKVKAEETTSAIKGMNDEANKSGKKNSSNGAKKQIEETGKAAEDVTKKIDDLEMKLYKLRDAGKKQKKTDTKPKQEFVSTYAEYEKLANGQTKEIYSEYNKELIDNSKNLQKMYEDKKLAIEANEKLLSSEKQVSDAQKQAPKTNTNTSTQDQTQQQEQLATTSAKAGETQAEAQNKAQEEITETTSSVEVLRKKYEELVVAFNNLPERKIARPEDYKYDYSKAKNYTNFEYDGEDTGSKWLASNKKAIEVTYKQIRDMQDAINKHGGNLNGEVFDERDVNQATEGLKGLFELYQRNGGDLDNLGIRMAKPFKDMIPEVKNSIEEIDRQKIAYDAETQDILNNNLSQIKSFSQLETQVSRLFDSLSKPNKHLGVSDIPSIYTGLDFDEYSKFDYSASTFESLCNELGIKIPQAANKAKEAMASVNETPVSYTQEQSGQLAFVEGLKETSVTEDKTKQDIVETNEAIQGQINMFDYLAEKKKQEASVPVGSSTADLEKQTKAAKDATKAQQELDAQEAKSKINYGAEEKASLSELVTYINKTVIPAINAKTKAFETEQGTVASVVKAERESLSGLKSDLTTIAEQLNTTFANGAGSKPIDTTTLLSSLKELTVDINTKPIVDVAKWQATIQAAMKSQTVEVKASADVTKLTAQEKSANTSKAKDYYEVMKQDLKEIKKLKEQLPNAGSEESVVIKQTIKQLQEQVRYRQEMIKQNNLEIVGEQKKVDLLTKEIEIINAKNKDKRNSASEAIKKSQEDNQIKITDESLTSDQWASTLEKLNLVEIKLGNIQSIVKSIRSVNGKDLISYKITDTNNDSITVGQNGKLDAGKQSLLDVGSAAKTLETNLQALYRAQTNIVKGNNVGFNSYLKEQAQAEINASRALLTYESEINGVQSATDALNESLKLEAGLQKDLDTARTKAGASSSTNTYDPILKSINQLINSEEKYLQLQAKKDVGTATDGELERLRLLTAQRKRDNDVIAQATTLTKKQQSALDNYNSTYSQQNKNSISQNFKSVESEKTSERYKATARLVEIEEKYQVLLAKRAVGTANNTDMVKLNQLKEEYEANTRIFNSTQNNTQSEIDMENKLIEVREKATKAAEEARAVGIGKSDKVLGSGYKDTNEAKKALEQYASTLGRISKRTEISPGLNSQMKTLKTTIIDDNNVMQELVATFNQAEGAGNSLSVSFGKSKEVLTGWAKAINTFETKYKQLFSYMSALYFNPYMMVGKIKSLVSEISEFQNSLVQISYTMDISNDQLTDMGDRAIETGKKLGTSAENMMDILKVYSNMETSTDEMLKQATPTAILANLSGEDASTASDQLQGIIREFNLAEQAAEDGGMHIVDVMDYVSSNIALDFSKGVQVISEASSTAGLIAQYSGMTFEEYSATIGKAAEITRQSGSELGNAFKINKIVCTYGNMRNVIHLKPVKPKVLLLQCG